jgi:hypothetical protein
MKKAVSELLASESADWHHRGLINAALAQQLGQRYDRQAAAWSTLTSWLGITAILLLSAAIIAAIGIYSELANLVVILLGPTAIGLWYAGIKLVTHPAQRHAVTGSALVTIGLAAAYGTLLLFTYTVIGDADFGPNQFFSVLLVTCALSLATAYRYRLRWPLLLALFCLFHGLGAWYQYLGGGEYVADIQNPPAMALIASVTTAVGLWHQHAEERPLLRYVGFGQLYVIFGLIYLNCSLWFLTIGWDYYNDVISRLGWVLIFSAVCIAEIVAGARLKDSKLTGFGIVFIGIDLYTRFFEQFWDQLSLGLFLVIAGAVGIVAGLFFEKRSIMSVV